MCQKSKPEPDKVQLDKGFEIKCLNCGSTECRVDNDFGVSDSGAWGSVKIVCPRCPQEETILGS